MHRQSIVTALALATTVFATSALPTTASAAEMPTRKAGLWEMKMTFEGRSLPPQAMQHCVDAKTDRLMNSQFGGMNERGLLETGHAGLPATPSRWIRCASSDRPRPRRIP